MKPVHDHTYLAWRLSRQPLHEKSSGMKWEIRNSWLKMTTVARTEWEKEQRTRTRNLREKKIRVGKKGRVVNFCNVKSINTEVQKRLLKYMLLSICLYLPLLFILSFPLLRQRGKHGCYSLMLLTAFTIKLLTGVALSPTSSSNH